MSSSSSYRPSHLHRVNLQSNGKRPFEECGYDSDPDASLNNGTQSSASGSSGSSHHFSSSSSGSTGAGDGRNKRARSTSSSSNSGHSSSSDVSSSTGYDTAPSSSRSDLSLSGPSALARDAVDCPIAAPALFGSQDGNVSNLGIELPHSAFTASVPETASISSEDNLRTSLQRFNEFERHIAALRSSIATSRPALLPQMGSSEHAPHQGWHAGSSTFQPMSSSGLNAPDTSDESTSTIRDDTFSSMSPFGSTNGIFATHPSASSTGSGPYPIQYSNLTRNSTLSPPYSPMSGRPSAENERSGVTIGSSPAPPGMASTRANVGMRQSSGSRLSPPPPPPQLRPTRRSPSPLILEPAVSPSSSDDTGLTGNRVVGSDLRLPVTHGRHDNISHEDFFERQPGEISYQFTTGDDRLTTAYLIRAESQVERAAPESSEIRHRVLRQHSVERGPTPSVFDVFGIGDSLFERDVTRRSQSPARERVAVSVRVPSSAVDIRAGASEFRMHGRTPNITSSTNRSSFHSRLYSMPSTNSLMSENAAEQRQMIAREQIWTPFHESGLDPPGYTSDESHSDGRPPSFTDSPPRTEGFMRSGWCRS
ncbi:hypothetical protein F5141DRAFT_507412 [Pisolithus sp. B1]|nr:hypothetical protein F5141DRAFT_507412 [Pisolithus sp. B1]